MGGCFSFGPAKNPLHTFPELFHDDRHIWGKHYFVHGNAEVAGLTYGQGHR